MILRKRNQFFLFTVWIWFFISSQASNIETDQNTIATDHDLSSSYSSGSVASPSADTTTVQALLGVETSTYATSTAGSDVCAGVPSAVQNLMISPRISTLDITWDVSETDISCIASFLVEWSQNSTVLGRDTTNSTEFTVSGLIACTTYTVNVSVITISNGTSEVQSATSTTSESELSPVVNLTAIGVDYGLIVTWILPEASACLFNYIINLLTDDSTEILQKVTVSSDTSFHEFTNLKACHKYTVQVIPISISGIHGIRSEVTQETSASVPGSISDLTISSITGTSIVSNWRAPTTNPECVKYYTVVICYNQNCTSKHTTDLSYEATELNPCREYTIAVSAVGDAGESTSTTIRAETSYVRPGAPQSLQVTPGQYSLFITWEAPSSGATCVANYRITLWDAVTYFTTGTNITIGNLIACRSYTTQVNPITTTLGDGDPAIVENISTNPSVYDPPVLNIETPWVTKDSISIGWRLDEIENECDLYSIVTTCKFISTDGHGFKEVDGSSTTSLASYDPSSLININVTVNNLSPFSTYSCSGITVNIAGNSREGNAVNAMTSEDVPSAPVLSTSAISSAQFTLSWTTPDYLPGTLQEHEIVLEWNQLFLMPSWCEKNSLKNTIDGIAGSTLSYIYKSAKPYSLYTVKVRAKTGAGWGSYSDTIELQTAPDVPGVVSNLTYANTPNATNTNILDTLLSWGLPCTLNGKLEDFVINVCGTRDGFETDNFTITYNGTGTSNENHIFTHNFGELLAEYNYTFSISTRVSEVVTLGTPAIYNAIYPAGIPILPEEWYIGNITLHPSLIRRTTSSSYILLPLFPNTNGEIQYYAIMVSELGQSEALSSRLDVSSGEWPNSSSWFQTINSEPIKVYQATPKWWDPNSTGHVEDYGHLQVVQFVIGENASCIEASEGSPFDTIYCNGPLRSDTWYYVRMRAFTTGGYADSTAFIIKTDAEFNLGMVLGIIFGILLFGLIMTMMVLVRRGVLQTLLRTFLHSDLRGSPMPDPYTKKKFQLHCQELIENPGKLSNEYQLLQTLSVDLQMSVNDACLQANRRKNRYMDILPYDITRVKLEVIDNDPNSDYINASFVKGYSGAVEYIACQGPKEDTTYDFWRMVFQYNVKIIVMVTQLIEKDKEKCHQYFPNKRENFEYDDIAIRCNTQLDFISYTQRTITLVKKNVKRTIIHLHFKEWSDHGVPDDFHSMIQFCQIVRNQMTDNKSIAVIHCSAGVGRTGTLIAIDILLQQIKDNKKLDVFGTVYKLRQHRINMVQTESQYAYIYNCTRQALKSPYMLKQTKQRYVEPTYENVPRKRKEIVDSNTNLVGSVETLKKISPASSLESMDLMNDVKLRRQEYRAQLSTLSNGLRYSKSTSAINTHGPANILVRQGSHEYPVYEPARDSISSRGSMDKNCLLEGPRRGRSTIALTRSRSVHYRDDLSNMYELKKDTSI